jgi:glycosyltransferase involved in cell wall biosynthesis
MKVLHLITGLSTGGAEMMLYKLVSQIDRDKFEMHVISLTDIGPIGERIQSLGVPVDALGMKRGIPHARMLFQLIRLLKKNTPDLIQSWMYHSDLMGGLAAKLAGNIPVVWGIRHSNLDSEGNKRTTIWTARACARFSRWLPVKIVCCSEASRMVHKELGYDPDRMVVIPNGFDLNLFKPDLEEEGSIRQELGISEDTILIGMAGRFDPQKDHRNFIKAATLLHAKIPDVQFLLCGDDITWENRKLSKWIDEAGLPEHFHLLGRRNDIPKIMTALDISSSSSSYGEGFPNVVGEAMACGTPCVVTDVGDSALIVGKTGIVVPPGDPDALALAWKELIEIGKDKRRKLGYDARLRVRENFSLLSVVKRYEDLYKSLA